MSLDGKAGADVGARWRLELVWSAKQDIANNRSTVTVELYWIGKDQYSAVRSSASKSGYITIDGTKTNFTASAGLSAKQRKKIGTASKTINHGSNGDKSFSISASFGMKVTLKGTYYSSKTISGTWNLNRIPRVSGASLNKSTVNYGETVRINIDKADSSFRHTINGKWGSKSISIADKTTASYVDWTVPNSLMNEIPNASSSWGRITIETYSGNDRIGTKELRLTTNVPNNINPSFSSLTASEQNSAVGFVGGYVQGLSKIKFTINGASGTYSSSISKYTINFDGQVKGNNGVWEPSFSGRKTATATITDSRGRTASKSINIDVIPYSPPTISTLDANRNDNGKGNKIIVNRSGNLSSLNGKNQITVTVDSSPKDKNTWGDASSSTGALGGTSFSAPVTLAGTYDVGTSYDIRVRARDKFNTVTATTTVSTAYYTMVLAKNGVGIGKIWQRGSLDLAGDVYSEGKLFAYGGLEIAGGTFADRQEGFGGLQLNNSDIMGANAIMFNDVSDNDRGEGLLFLKSNKPSGSPNKDTDYDNLFMRDGELILDNVGLIGGIDSNAPIRTDNKKQVYFNHPNCVYFDKYGNIMATPGAGVFRVKDKDGGDVFKIDFKFNGDKLFMDNDGTNYIGSKAFTNRTYSNAANVVVTSNGVLGRSTSASKYKIDIKEVDTDKFNKSILDLKVKSWHDKAAAESHAKYLELLKTDPEEAEKMEVIPTELYMGLIAEDVEAVGLDKFCSYQYNDDGTKEIEGIQYERLWTMLLPIIKEHEEKLNSQGKTLWTGVSPLSKEDIISPDVPISGTVGGWGLTFESSEKDEDGDIVLHTEYISKTSLQNGSFKTTFTLDNGYEDEKVTVKVSDEKLIGSARNVKGKMRLRRVFAW